MGLGLLLKDILAGHKQSAVAAGWLARWKERSGKDFSQAHVESSLSRCVKEHMEGVRFFFEDRERAAILFDIVEAPYVKREEILKAAEALLAEGGGRPPRFVIDVSRWESDQGKTSALFVAVEEQLLAAVAGEEVRVVVTENQYRWLPRTFDDRDGLRIERVPVGAGEPVGTRLAGDTALVVAPWRFASFERWAAIDLDGEDIRISPPDALLAFARDGRLPPLPVPERELSVLPPDAVDNKRPSKAPPPLPIAAPELRDLMVALSSAEGAAALKTDAATRLAWASSLSIHAAATEREAVEADILDAEQKLGLEADSSNQAQERLERHLERATRREIEPTAFRIGDEIVVVANEGAFADPPALPRVTWHIVERRPSALARLREALSTYTEDDFVDDPFLEQLLQRLDPDGRDVIPLAHARDALLRGRPLKVAPSKRCADWTRVLEKLVSERPPSALLRVPFPSDLDLVPKTLLARATPTDRWTLAIVPAAGDLLLAREDEMAWWPRRRFPFRSHEGDAQPDIDECKWEESLELWYDKRRYLNTEAESPWHRPSGSMSQAEMSEPKWAQTYPSGQSWADVDRLLSTVWFALRRTANSSEVIQVPSGAHLIHVGAGICVEVDAREHVRRDGTEDLRAAFVTAVHELERDVWLKCENVTAHVTTARIGGSVYEPGYELPRQVYLSGHGFAADIKFAFAPWLAGTDTAARMQTPIVSRLRDDEIQRQREQEEADDDE